MKLIKDKLEGYELRPDGTAIAQCPACAKSGGDSKKKHLIIYSDGKFGCAAFQGDTEHRKKIFRLAGSKKRTVRVTVNPKPSWKPPKTP